MRTSAMLFLAALLVVGTPAAAHGPPPVRDQDIRLLADHNDDCGGDDAGELSNCRGTHDLVALDVREAYDATLGDVVVFRLLMNLGQAGAELHDVITVSGPTGTMTFAFTTDDDETFAGTGFAKVTGPTSVNDGTRFVVEGTVRRSTLGDVGDTLTDYTVDAYRADTKGDFMPGGYQTAAGPVQDPPQGDGPANLVRPDYDLRGPGYYVSLGADEDEAAGEAGEDIAVEVLLENEFRNTAQSIEITASADGADVALQTGSGEPDYDDTTATLALAKASDQTVTLYVRSASAATGDVTLVATSNLGGRTTLVIPFDIDDDGTTPEEPPSDDDGGGGKGSPGPAWALLAALFLATLLRRK